MKTRLLTTVLAALLLCGSSLDALAASCRYQEMRLLQLQSTSASKAEIANARAMLDACQGKGPPVDLWGDNDRGFWRDNDWGRASREPEPQPRLGGTLRTWCVRRCDGYYFPISFSTTRDRLEYDNVVCQTLCPAGQAELFYHYTHGQGPEQMRSLGDEAYTDLETAFNYRTSLSEACTCGRPNSPLYAPTAASPLMASLVPEPAFVPRARPPIGQDPETALNRLGNLTFATPAESKPVKLQASSGVRVILPARSAADSSDLLLSPIPTERPDEDG